MVDWMGEENVLGGEFVERYMGLVALLEDGGSTLSESCGFLRVLGVFLRSNGDRLSKLPLVSGGGDIEALDYIVDRLTRENESKYFCHLSNLAGLVRDECVGFESLSVPSGVVDLSASMSNLSKSIFPNLDGLEAWTGTAASGNEKKSREPKQRLKSYIYKKSDLDCRAATTEEGSKTEFVSALDRLEENMGRTGKSSTRKRTHFQTPFVSSNADSDSEGEKGINSGRPTRNKEKKGAKPSGAGSTEIDRKIEELDKFDNEIKERILNEILDSKPGITFNDISGLLEVKQILQEMIILPALHPELFRGILSPPRGLLLFGPPGNGKTMIARAIAAEAKMTFFSISASVLCSKWIGEGEKTMKALFIIARAKAPSFIFIDEIDSILSCRSNDEHESSRRLKNEFLLQFDGAMSDSSERVTVMGATNRPFDLDEAARRRFSKRIYVPLPEPETRRKLLNGLLSQFKNQLTQEQIDLIVNRLDGYSCSDISNLTKDAAYQPIRELLKAGRNDLLNTPGQIRPVSLNDFIASLQTIKPSVATEECKMYEDFKLKFGSSSNACHS